MITERCGLVRPLVLATRNPGKILEFRELLSGFPVEIKSLDAFGPIPTCRRGRRHL
jgi:inosine/xanthosine triphosphate pyrophosphatase family protein